MVLRSKIANHHHDGSTSHITSRLRFDRRGWFCSAEMKNVRITHFICQYFISQPALKQLIENYNTFRKTTHSAMGFTYANSTIIALMEIATPIF